jgi:hypothetical protein
MEIVPEQPNLPSGYISAEQLPAPLQLGHDMLPWIGEGETAAINLTRCTLTSGVEFLVGSALKTHDRLAKAAQGMNEQQQRNCDNMFYSRVAGYIEGGLQSSNVENMPDTAAPFAIKVLRNNGGQRVYFGLFTTPGTGDLPVVLRLAACDKERQVQVMKIISGKTDRSIRRLAK